MSLSVVIITREEERDLPGCLSSIRDLADEVIVVDSLSKDRTGDIAKQFGAKVYERTFDDFAAQKQAATDLASSEWILSLDADERVTPELAVEIKRVLGTTTADAFDIPFQVWFLGSRLRFGGLGREHHIRLFRKRKGHFEGTQLHEGILVDGNLGTMTHAITHIPYRDINEYLSKMALYTDRAAQKRYENGIRFHAGHHLLPFWEFFMRVFLKFGILDGFSGILWAGLSSFHTWIKYAKLREMDA